MAALPDLKDRCGSTFTYRDFVECGETWLRTRGDNVPREPATFDAMRRMAGDVLDPLAEVFGRPRLTYGFASAALCRQILQQPFPNISPRSDQHAGLERNSRGNLLCPRRGFAVDLMVPGLGSLAVARWVVRHTPFDRLYFYDDDRPFHVSVGPEETRQIVLMKGVPGGRHRPGGRLTPAAFAGGGSESDESLAGPS